MPVNSLTAGRIAACNDAFDSMKGRKYFQVSCSSMITLLMNSGLRIFFQKSVISCSADVSLEMSLPGWVRSSRLELGWDSG